MAGRFLFRGVYRGVPWKCRLYLSRACEWPENIDVRRAEESKRRAEERLRQKQSMREMKMTRAALARSMARPASLHPKTAEKIPMK